MDHYRNLGLPNNASNDAVKTAYRKLTKKYNPENNKSKIAEEKFRSVNDSYEFIMRKKGLIKFKPANHDTQKRKPNRAFDLNGDGKFSKKEYQALKEHRLQEAARTFYNLHETSLSFRFELGAYYAIITLIMTAYIIVPIICLYAASLSGLIAAILLLLIFIMPLYNIIYDSNSAIKNRAYIKIIREKYESNFKILGIFLF